MHNVRTTVIFQYIWLSRVFILPMCKAGREGTMLGAHQQKSEVARLLSQISDEYEAAQRGMSGLAYGVSQHEFITARMENMGQLHGQLHSLVGDLAIAMIAEQLN